MLRDGRKMGFRTVTVGGVVLGVFAVPLKRRLKSEPRTISWGMLHTSPSPL